MMRTVFSVLFFTTLASSSVFANEQEIEHLLKFVAQSNCSFQRNGELHTPEKAREHIEKKYQYLKKRIKTTEQFIGYAASRSSISKKPYTVTCEGRQLTSEQWLTTELSRFREFQKVQQ